MVHYYRPRSVSTPSKSHIVLTTLPSPPRLSLFSFSWTKKLLGILMVGVGMMTPDIALADHHAPSAPDIPSDITNVPLQFDLTDPEEALKARRRIFCSAVDGEPAIFWWQGDMYSRVPGERDRHLFDVQGVNVRACGTHTNELGSYGYRMVSREVMLYIDPETQEVLDTWQNPWTDQTVEVFHVANDPVNGRPRFAYTEEGSYEFTGLFANGQLFLRSVVPLFYPNPLGGDFQDYVGGTYHAMELFDYMLPEAELLDATTDTVDTVLIGWNRLSNWLPWMQMGDRPGLLIFDAVGMRASSWDELPDILRREIEAEYPLYQSPPPLDDDRPNATSWTNFRDYIQDQRDQTTKP